MPVAPQADREPTLYFIKGPVLKAAPPAEHTRIAQVLLDAASVYAQRAAQLPVGDDRRALLNTAESCGETLTVMMKASAAPAAALAVFATEAEPFRRDGTV